MQLLTPPQFSKQFFKAGPTIPLPCALDCSDLLPTPSVTLPPTASYRLPHLHHADNGCGLARPRHAQHQRVVLRCEHPLYRLVLLAVHARRGGIGLGRVTRSVARRRKIDDQPPQLGGVLRLWQFPSIGKLAGGRVLVSLKLAPAKPLPEVQGGGEAQEKGGISVAKMFSCHLLAVNCQPQRLQTSSHGLTNAAFSPEQGKQVAAQAHECAGAVVTVQPPLDAGIKQHPTAASCCTRISRCAAATGLQQAPPHRPVE